jgi:hypothetical protein
VIEVSQYVVTTDIVDLESLFHNIFIMCSFIFTGVVEETAEETKMLHGTVYILKFVCCIYMYIYRHCKYDWRRDKKDTSEGQE